MKDINNVVIKWSICCRDGAEYYQSTFYYFLTDVVCGKTILLPVVVIVLVVVYYNNDIYIRRILSPTGASGLTLWECCCIASTSNPVKMHTVPLK